MVLKIIATNVSALAPVARHADADANAVFGILILHYDGVCVKCIEGGYFLYLRMLNIYGSWRVKYKARYTI